MTIYGVTPFRCLSDAFMRSEDKYHTYGIREPMPPTGVHLEPMPHQPDSVTSMRISLRAAKVSRNVGACMAWTYEALTCVGAKERDCCKQRVVCNV